MTHPIRDHLPLLARDMVAAFGLLSRIPVPFTLPRPAGVWSWPLVGLVTGGAALALGALSLWAGVSVGVAAVLVMAVQVACKNPAYWALHAFSCSVCSGSLSRFRIFSIAQRGCKLV
jgi:hypothetical protein